MIARTKRASFAGALAVWLFAAIGVRAGTLDDFQKDVNSPPNPAGHHSDESGGNFLFELFEQMFAQGFVYGGNTSWVRVGADLGEAADFDVKSRELGDVLIPFLRADATYQALRSDVAAFDVAADAGYGPFAVRFDQTRYWEDDPRDTLDLTRVYGLYRMSFGPAVEIDLGLGALTISGDEGSNDRFSFTTPILVHPNRYVGVEFRPAWAANVEDYDLALMAGPGFVSVKAGYRWVRSPHESLDGPYVGISVHF